MLPIGNRAYVSFGDVMEWAGDGFSGIAREIIPVQDMNASLLNRFVSRTLYQIELAPAASASLPFVWAVASDWDEVQVNGVVQVDDSQLPQPTDERILVHASLEIAGTATEYTRAELSRDSPTVQVQQMLVMQWGTLPGTLLNATPTAPFLLPQTLSIGETGGEYRVVVSGANALLRCTVEMISAQRGVMRPFPGV